MWSISASYVLLRAKYITNRNCLGNVNAMLHLGTQLQEISAIELMLLALSV
jgi:hypothetical protein